MIGQAAETILSNYPHIRLNKEQAEKLNSILDELEKSGNTRPTATEYQKVEKELLKIKAPKPTGRIPGTISVPQDPQNRWPAPLIRVKDGETPKIPEGLGFYPLHTADNTQSVINAARLTWTVIWNYWRNLGSEGRRHIIQISSNRES